MKTAKYTCLIVDDEPIAIRVIKNHLQNFSTIEITGECNNAIEAVEFLGKRPVDLIFLDIQMPQLTGIELLQTIQNPPLVIITTAYRDYALDAFELEVLDYLLKPFSLPRFTKAINRFFQRISEQHNIDSTQKTSNELEYIFVKADKKIHKISLTEIVYIESLGDYSIIHTEKGKITTKEKISLLNDKLPTSQFIRVHRSYILSINKITSFLAGAVEIKGEKIPIGRSYKNSIDNFLENN